MEGELAAVAVIVATSIAAAALLASRQPGGDFYALEFNEARLVSNEVLQLAERKRQTVARWDALSEQIAAELRALRSSLR